MTRAIAIPALCALASLFASCSEDDTCDLDINDVCTRVMECGGFGFQTQAECESHFIGDPAFGTECASTEAYFECMCDAIGEETCKEFSDEEGACWLDNCE